MLAWEQRAHGASKPGKGLSLLTMEQLSGQGLEVPADLWACTVSRWDREGRERGAGRRQAVQLMECFATRNFRCQDVALGSDRGCHTVRGWGL